MPGPRGAPQSTDHQTASGKLPETAQNRLQLRPRRGAQAWFSLIKHAEGVCLGSKAPPDRTSAGRAKHIRPEGISAIRTAASNRGTMTYENLAGLFEYGCKSGARPCELFGARLEGRTLIITSANVSTE